MGQELATKHKIDFDKDIKPWVGNGMVAVLPAEAENRKQPNLLAVVGIRDKVGALQFANKLANQSGGKGKEFDYKGNKVFSSPDNSIYATVIQDNYLVISPGQKAVEMAIDTAKGEPSLASKPDVANVLAKAPTVQNPLVQVYMLDYATAIQQLSGPSLVSKRSPSPFSPGMLQQLKQVKSLVADIGIDDAGLRMKATTQMNSDAPKFEYKPSPGRVIAQFPADTLMLVSGAHISQLWSQALEQAKSNSEVQQSVDMMRRSLKSANFDLDKEIFGWMDGEFGIGLIPSDQGILTQTGVGGMLVFDTSDRKTAEATMSKFDNFAKGNAVLVQQRDVQGKKVTEWNSPMGVVLGHGWLDDDSLFVALGGPIVDVATKQPNPALNATDSFKAATSSLPQQNLGYFYVDMDKTMTLVNRFAAMAQSPMPPELASVLNSIKGIGITSNQADPSTTQMEMLLALKKAK